MQWDPGLVGPLLCSCFISPLDVMNTIAIVNHTSGVKKKLKGQKYSKLILYPSIKYKKTTIRYESKHIVNKYTLILSKTVFSFYRTDTISKYFRIS